MSVAAEILAAAQAALEADDTLKTLMGGAARVYDQFPAVAGRTFPYLTLDRVDGLPEDAEGVPGDDVTLTFSSWSRPTPAIGKREAARLVARAEAVLIGAGLALPSYRLIDGVREPSQIFTDPDGLTQHGVGAVTFLTEPVA